MKTKLIRIKWSDWKWLRANFKAKRNETFADYINRVLDTLINERGIIEV